MIKGADLWAGFSQGGRTVYEALGKAYKSGAALPIGAILIEPGIGPGNWLDPAIFEQVRVITWADERIAYPYFEWAPQGGVHGWIFGALHFKTDDCGGDQHCPHGDWQAMMVQLAFIPPGFVGTLASLTIASARDVVVECHLRPRSWMGDGVTSC